MKKALLIVMAFLMLVGCSKEREEYQNAIITSDKYPFSENESGFEKAVFSKFNSYASENGLAGAQIFVDGRVLEKNITGHDIALILEDDNGDEWAVLIGVTGKFEIAKADNLVGMYIRACGSYSGYSDVINRPVIRCEKKGTYIVKSRNGLPINIENDYGLARINNIIIQQTKTEHGYDGELCIEIDCSKMDSDERYWFNKKSLISFNDKSHEDYDKEAVEVSDFFEFFQMQSDVQENGKAYAFCPINEIPDDFSQKKIYFNIRIFGKNIEIRNQCSDYEIVEEFPEDIYNVYRGTDGK